MNLTIADTSYIITNATLLGYIKDPAHANLYSEPVEFGLFWRLEVKVRDEWIQFAHEWLHYPNLRRWMDLVNQTVSWDEPKDKKSGELIATWYGGNFISGHHEIPQAVLRFVEIQGSKLHLQWRGRCAGYPAGSRNRPEEELPFSIDCWVDFIGVSVGVPADSINSKCDLLMQYLEPSDFIVPIDDLSPFTPRPFD